MIDFVSITGEGKGCEKERRERKKKTVGKQSWKEKRHRLRGGVEILNHGPPPTKNLGLSIKVSGAR